VACCYCRAGFKRCEKVLVDWLYVVEFHDQPTFNVFRKTLDEYRAGMLDLKDAKAFFNVCEKILQKKIRAEIGGNK